jgi:hypothetical protein
MPVFSGTPTPIARALGQVDQEDQTNLPPGCAALCLNTDFTRDSTGQALSFTTRAGNNMIMAGSKSPGTGFWDFQWEPESATDPFFQMPVRFTLSGILEREYPVGTGRMTPVPAGMFALPPSSHKIDTQAGNILWSAYSNLITPTAGLSGFNPKTLKLDPLGMKPYGWQWVPLTTVIYANEVATPSNQNSGPQGNGHTYQAQNNGATGPIEPVWPVGPLSEGAIVIEVLSPAQIAAGLVPVTWKELTMVIANRIPAPPAPVLTLVNGGGTFPPAQDVYIGLMFSNGMGFTVLGGVSKITTTAAAQQVSVQIPTLASLPGWLSQLVAPYAITDAYIFEADVPTGDPQPPQSLMSQVPSPVPLGAAFVVSGPVSASAPPPTINSARITPGQLPQPDEEAQLTRAPAAGAFPANRDVYVRLSFANANGETPLGPSNSIIDTLAADAVQVALTQLQEVQEFPQLMIINVYEADVPTGTAEPPKADYALAFVSGPGQTVTITGPAAGKPPVTVNGTGPGGNIAADTEDGGINATQGYRYAVPAWVNRNETVSGFTEGAVSKYIVDEDGWEISVFNVPIGPLNIVARLINWSVADSTQAGPFWWIGLLNLLVPTQNQVYPVSFQSDSITIIPTIFADNVTTTGTFNFTDQFLEAANDTTDRLTVGAPPIGAVRIDYLTTCDRLALAGVQGQQTGLVISLGSDYESYYTDNSFLPISSAKGEVCWGCVEFRNQIYAMRSQSAFVITPGTGNPNSWDAKQRWGPTSDSEGVGPCGPRAFAANGQFIAFVHRTGLYKFDGTGAPDLMTKEIPRMWGSINWQAAQFISLMIDNDTHTVRIQVPTGRSVIPNREFCVSYIEGWLNPLHFSSFGQKEISQEACRRWAFNDVSAYICRRILRTVPNPPPLPLGPDGTSQLTSDFYLSQLAYTQTDQSGFVNARTPGRFSDNGAGIDFKYMTISAKAMQKPSKPEAVTTSCVGFGSINVSFVAGRNKITDPQGPRRILRMRPMDLTPQGNVDYTRKPERGITDEYWSVLYDNGKQPDAWVSIKNLTAYVIPVKIARGSLDTGR